MYIVNVLVPTCVLLGVLVLKGGGGFRCTDGGLLWAAESDSTIDKQKAGVKSET